MHILVTRPEADAAALKVPLEAMGHTVSLAPMIDISFASAEPVDLESCVALVATSRNGLRGLERQLTRLTPDIASVPLYAVGPATAAAARALGFHRVIEGPASAADLVPLIARDLKPSDGPLVHAAGDTLAFDLKAALTPLGFTVRPVVVYRSVPATGLPARVAADLSAGSIDAVILMSPQTARTFVSVTAVNGLDTAARRLRFVCLSDAVLGQLDDWQPIKTVVARTPNLAETLAAVQRLTEQFR